jgi:hypothetical protein
MIMVNKSKKLTSGAGVKVGKMKVNKETVKDLSSSEKKQIKGGQKPENTYTKQSVCAEMCC